MPLIVGFIDDKHVVGCQASRVEASKHTQGVRFDCSRGVTFYSYYGYEYLLIFTDMYLVLTDIYELL